VLALETELEEVVMEIVLPQPARRQHRRSSASHPRGKFLVSFPRAGAEQLGWGSAGLAWGAAVGLGWGAVVQAGMGGGGAGWEGGGGAG
jgi:hypothetical protein